LLTTPFLSSGGANGARSAGPLFGAVRPGEAAPIYRDVCVTSTAHNPFLSSGGANGARSAGSYLLFLEPFGREKQHLYIGMYV